MAKLGQPRTSAGPKPGPKIGRSVEQRRAWLEISDQMVEEAKGLKDSVLRDVYLEASTIARERADLALSNAAHGLIDEKTNTVERLIESHLP